jgi:uncharacterized protein (TIGR00255 family)
MTVASMTGFSRAVGALGSWTWSVEARSVNGRSLEVRFRGPPGLEGLERACREAAQRRLHRGQVGVTVQAQRSDGSPRLQIDEGLIDRYLALARRLEVDGRVARPTADGLFALPGVVRLTAQEDGAEATADLEVAMADTIDVALAALADARLIEGAATAAVVGAQLDAIADLIATCRVDAAAQPQLIKQRFERRMIELAGDAVAPERLAQEAAALAVRADVEEELDRLDGHVAAARSLLTQGGAVGRRLDFLTQEFMRESNTLTSKSASATLTAGGLELKAVIDQMREQAQNVE